MKVKKTFGKIDILKTQELVSFWGIKTHFGKIALKWCIFRHKKIDFNPYYAVAFDPNKIFTHWAPQNVCLNLSFVKDNYVVAKEMTRNGRKMGIFETWIFIVFSYNIEKHSWRKNLS